MYIGEAEILSRVAWRGNEPHRGVPGVAESRSSSEKFKGPAIPAARSRAPGRTVAQLLAAGAMLTATACSDHSREGDHATESAKMSGKDKPWWHDMYAEQKAKSRERTAKLVAASGGYSRPAADPDIQRSSIGNSITLVDKRTGDYLLVQSGDREHLLVTFLYNTKDGQLVRGFRTQMSGGFGMEWDRYPIRVYETIESEQSSEEIRSARERISLERFAKFLTAFPTFADNPDLDFVVFEAPLEPGERL